MLYYRVKKEFDNKQLYKRNGNTLYYYDFLIGNELKTKTEYKKIIALNANYNRCFETVNISKKSVYFSFGARFS